MTNELFVVSLQKENAMCTVTVNIDENLLRSLDPNLSNKAAIQKWAQELVDCRIQEMIACHAQNMHEEEK